jgi:hypothetical protein
MKMIVAAITVIGLQGVALTFPLSHKSTTFEWCVEKEAKRWAGSKLSTDEVARIAWDACPSEWAAARRAAKNVLPYTASPEHVDGALRDYEARYRKTVRGIVDEVRGAAE